MGINFYRFVNETEFKQRKKSLIRRITLLDVETHGMNDFRSIENEFSLDEPMTDPWETFMDGIKVHLGKRTHGWKFCWNFHNKKYYDSKKTLLDFIKKGRIFDQYGIEYKPDDFIEMALNWAQPDGLVYDENFIKKHNSNISFDSAAHWDKIIDDLRVSSSTKFN